MYVLMQLSLKREWTSTISSSKQSPIFCISFEDQRLERTDFAVVHDSSSTGAGPSVALFRKFEDGESSDKILSWRAAIKWVTWQLLSKFLCSLSVRVTQWSQNVILDPAETCKLSFHSYIITYRLFALAKTDAENCKYMYLPTHADW